MGVIMKKKIVLLFALVFCLFITACDSQKEGNGGTEDNSESIAGDTEDTDIEGENLEVIEDNGWSKEMEAIQDAVVSAMGDNYWPNARVTREMLAGTYNISDDLYDDYLGEVPLISTNVDTLLILKAKEGKLDELEDAVYAYRETLVDDTLQYPMNIGKIQASRIEVMGEYVCFVMLGASAVENDSQEEVITQCGEQNELALAVIGGILRQ